MNEKLPYEEQLNQAWDEIPLPDEDMAWRDMKRRLDEDEDDKIVMPPPRKGCGIGALLIGLLLLGGFWLLLRPEKWFMKKETETAQQTRIPNEQQNVNNNNNKESSPEKTDDQRQRTKNIDTTNKTETKTVKENAENTSLQKENKQESETKVEIKTTEAGSTKIKSVSKTILSKTKHSTPVTSVKRKNIKQAEQKEMTSTDDKIKSKSLKNADTLKVKSDPVVANLTDDQLPKKEITESKQDDTPVAKKQDSITIRPADSVAVKKIDQSKTETTSSIKKEKQPKQIFFSAGIGLHQQIPIAGQEWTTYGSLGRKGILSDYIPSINFRMEKEKRWFLQTEFRYGAPQHTKQFTYSQKISIDTFTQAVITNSSNLKKTFYHQAPLTFNYYVLPNWSFGAGVQWNKFYSAVAEQDITRRNPGTTTDSVISKRIVKVSNDSSTALVKSWWQGVVQTQYQWKRFSIGARYSFGLQPYIKFTLPGQPLQQEKNSSLQLFLRYELWRSKK